MRGSEDDVLARFLIAIKETKASHIVRITGDNPLINTENISLWLQEHLKNGADITNYQPGYEYVDKGIEIVSVKALLQVDSNSQTTPHDREHVTARLYREPEAYKIHYMESETYLRRGDIRLTVDTPQDLEFWESLCQSMEKTPQEMDFCNVIEHLDENPHLLKINAGAGRKSTLHERVRIGFRCDGNAEIGMGHIVGCIRLAKDLAQEFGWGIEFLTRKNDVSVSLIQKSGFAIETLPDETSPEKDINRVLEKWKESDWSAVIFNFCKRDLDRYASAFQKIPSAGLPLVFMDNPVPSSYQHGDLLINSLPHPDYHGYHPENKEDCYDGLEYFLLNEAFLPYRDRSRSISQGVQRILIAMGGGDLNNITSLILEGLAEAKFDGYVDVVLGAANPHENHVRELFQKLGFTGEIHLNVTDLPQRMWEADLGFSALGLTTYEMAFMGLPVILIAGSEFNAGVADLYTKRYSGAIHLGFYKNVTPNHIAHVLREEFTSPEQRKHRSEQQSKSVDGQGSARVLSIFRDWMERFTTNPK